MIAIEFLIDWSWPGLTMWIIETNIARNSDLFKAMVFTPMSTAVNAVAQLVTDQSLTGKVVELLGEHVSFAEPPAYVDEATG